MTAERSFVVIGGGPAGLTAAYQLAKLGFKPVVLEKDNQLGGIARTDTYKGFYFDMGGHRFFTKAQEVDDLWHEVLGGEFLKRPRLSRIFYQGKFFHYPLKALDALKGLGPVEAVLIGLSWARWKLFPHRVEETFEQWVTNRFGKRLFRTFFETYTEKVWGIKCSELKAEWAAQRIKDLSLATVLVSLFIKPKKTIKTLIEEFNYPRLGPGMMWRAFGDRVEQMAGAGSVRLNSDVVGIERNGNSIRSVRVKTNGREDTIPGTDFVSSMPVTEFIRKLDPPAPASVLEAARRLKYRDFLTVCLIIDQDDLFPDNWIYVHDASVKVARIQNFKNWSPEMVPDPSKSSLGLEYFCTEGDEVWTTPDAELVELARKEVDRIGLARYDKVTDGCVVRVAKAYPVYDSEYRAHLAVVREFMDGLQNARTVGRNGLHRYNNQDHSMLTAMLAVRSLLHGESHDLWSVNADMEYHEEDVAKPRRRSNEELLREALATLLARVDPVAAGVAAGVVSGALLFLATMVLVLKGGASVGPNLGLLSQYFPGYQVTVEGSLVGLVYGSVAGYIAGWSFAALRNNALLGYVKFLQWRANRAALRKLLDEI